MKILMLAPQPFFVERGTPIAVRAAAEALCRAGHEVDLVVFHEGEDIAFPGLRLFRTRRLPLVRHVRIGLSPAKLICGLWLLVLAFRLLARGRYDVIHAVEEAIYPALLAKLVHRVRVVHDMDSLMVDQIVEKWAGLRHLRAPLDWIEAAAARRADMVMPVCTFIAQRVAAIAPRQKIHLLPDIAMPAPAGPAPAEVMDLRCDLSPDALVVLYVGNLETYQGVALLIDAMALLPEQTPCRLIVVGGSPQAIEAASERSSAQETADRIDFRGAAPFHHLPWLLAQADILASPRSKGVNTPMKIYAYMAASRAILATDIVSHTQVLDDRSALLVAPTAGAIAQGLALLADDEGLRGRLGRSAARRSRDYSPEAFDRRIRAAYADLEAGKLGSTPNERSERIGNRSDGQMDRASQE